MIHADKPLVEALARACQRNHPGVRIENWRIYVRAVIAAINSVTPASHHGRCTSTASAELGSGQLKQREAKAAAKAEE